MNIQQHINDVWSAMRILCSFYVILIAAALTAHAQRFEWVQMGTGGKVNYAAGLALDSTGNVYSTGYFSSSAFSTNRFSGIEPKAFGSEDIYLVSYDNAGTIRWIKSAGNADYDNVADICVDRAGYIYIVGRISGSSYTFDTTTYQGSQGLLGFIAKYDPLGNIIWVRRDTGIAFSLFTGVACGPDGNLYVAGRYEQMAFAAGYTPDGTQLWRNATTGSGTMHPSAITVDDSGNVFTCGTMVGSLFFDSIEVKSKGNNYYDGFIAKYAPDGKVKWVGTEHHGSYDDVFDIGTDQAGNSYICGENFKGGFLSMYDSAGTQRWTRALDGTGNAMAVEPSGAIYLTGGYWDRAQFDSISLPAPPPTGNGDAPDLYVAKLGAGGRFEWARGVHGNKSDEGNGIAFDRDGYIYLTGDFGDDWVLYDSMYFDDTILRGTADRSVFTAKLNPFVPIADVNQPATTHGITLHSPSPTPSSGSSLISFELPRSMPVRLSLFNDLGEEVQLLLDDMQEEGLQMVRVDNAMLTSGVYHIRFVADGVVLPQRMIVVQ